MHIIVIASECGTNLTQRDQEPMEGCLRSNRVLWLCQKIFRAQSSQLVPMVIIFPASSGYVYPLVI